MVYFTSRLYLNPQTMCRYSCVIQMETEKRAQVAQPTKQDIDTHITQPLPENINRLQVDGEEARSVEEAISVLRLVVLCHCRLYVYFNMHFVF